MHLYVKKFVASLAVAAIALLPAAPAFADGISLEVGDLAKTRVLIEKNAKRTLAPYIGIYDHSFLLPAELSLWHVD